MKINIKKGVTKSQKMKVVAPPAVAEKEWTFMVYMAGDNNLSDDMITAIEAIKSGVLSSMTGTVPPGAGSNNVAFLVEYDGDHPLVRTRRMDLTYTPGKPYAAPGVPPDEIPEADESKSTEEKIQLFIEWAVGKHAAENYALIISGHSDGFRGRTFLLDDDPQSVASLQKLVDHLDIAIKNVKKDPIKYYFPKTKFDFLCFDSCVMSSLEIMYQFKDHAEVWVGSQGSIPNYTWNYFGIAQELSKKKVTDLTYEKVAEVITSQVKAYNDPYAFQGRSTDISAANLAMIEDLASNFLNFTFQLLDITYFNPPPLSLSTYWSRIMIDAHVKCQTFMCEHSIDIWDFCDCLLSGCTAAEIEIRDINAAPSQPVQVFLDQIASLKEAISSVNQLPNGLPHGLKKAIETFVFATAHTTSGGDYRFAKGVSAFKPWSLLAFLMAEDRYAELDFIKGTLGGLLWAVYTAIQLLLDARPEIPLAHIMFPPNILTLSPMRNAPNLQTGMTQVDVLTALDHVLGVLGTGVGFRDAPPKSRGTDEYLEYFRNTKNFRPSLEP